MPPAAATAAMTRRRYARAAAPPVSPCFAIAETLSPSFQPRFR
jgi:hypothetical protein